MRAAGFLVLAMATTPALTPALAQPALPSRDVDVIYGAAQNVQQRWRYRAADQKLRLDPPTAGLHMIIDYKAYTMAIVNDTDRTVLTLAAPPAPGTSGAAARGTDSLLGQPCTEWEQRDVQNQPTLACYTADGVMLRARRGTQVLVEAIAVRYATPDPAAFTIPAGYERVAK